LSHSEERILTHTKLVSLHSDGSLSSYHCMTAADHSLLYQFEIFYVIFE